jgi:uncharacterized membrane protein
VLLIGVAVLTVVLSWTVINRLHHALRRPALPLTAGRNRVRYRPGPAASRVSRIFGVVIVAGTVNLISGLFR